MLTKLVTLHHPSGLVAAWDNDWRPAWRVELVPSYKTHRLGIETSAEEVPDTLSPQIDAIAALLDAWGVARIGIDGFEADDVIASVAAQRQGRSCVVTSDRDLIQVVTDRVSLLLQVTGGVEGWPVLGPEAIKEKYGVSPTKYLAMAALRGDPSDGLPGIAGIGEKTAAALINEYGDLTELIKVSSSDTYDRPLTPRLAERVTAGSQYLHDALAVITAETRLPVAAWDTDVPYEPVDMNALREISMQWGVEKYVDELLQAALG